MAEKTTQPGASPGAEAALAVAPDALTAEILRKHAAGEKLTPQEYGKLGAFKAKAKYYGPARAAARSAPAPAPTAAGAPGPVGAPAAPPLDGQGAPAVDPALVRATTEAILKTCDQMARAWVVSEARKAGADHETARVFDQKAALQEGPRQIMVETSPAVLASMGIDASNYPAAAFVTGLGVWAGSLLMTVSQLRAMQEERAKDQASQATSAKGQAIPETRPTPKEV